MKSFPHKPKRIKSPAANHHSDSSTWAPNSVLLNATHDVKIASPLHDDPWFPRHFLLLFFLFFYFKKDVIFLRTLSGSRENGEGGAEVSRELPPLHKPRLPVAGRLPVTTFFTKNEPASTRHQSLLLALHILWVFTEVSLHVSIRTQSVFIPLKILCALPVHSSPSPWQRLVCLLSP